MLYIIIKKNSYKIDVIQFEQNQEYLIKKSEARTRKKSSNFNKNNNRKVLS